MRQILLVEDSAMFGRLAKAKIEKVFDVPVYWAKTYTDAVEILERGKNNFSVALLDYNLPDAPNGEVIDEVVNRGISALVFTSNMTDEVRELVWLRKVADYVLKDDPNSLDYIVTAIKRMEENEKSMVLVIEGSDHNRTILSELLYIQKYRVVTAKNGQAALGILEEHPAIKLVVTEYHLEDMDGWALCQAIRKNFKHDDLAIIGMSSQDEKNIGARFIKSGANDFIVKESFLVEEFYCRVNQCVTNIDLIRKTRDQAVRDYLTGLYNRRYFFDEGAALFRNSKTDQQSLICAMLDIDFFKKVNDTHGHDVGDLVICHVSRLMQDSFRKPDFVARFGGEEFCVLAQQMSRETAWEKFEELRQLIATTPVSFNGGADSLNVTVSIGVCASDQPSLEQMTQKADLMLYQAKEGGRNRVEIS